MNCSIHITNITCPTLLVPTPPLGYRLFCEGYQGFQLLVVFEKFIPLVKRLHSSYMKYSETMSLLSMTILWHSETMQWLSETLPCLCETIPCLCETMLLLIETIPWHSETMSWLRDTVQCLLDYAKWRTSGAVLLRFYTYNRCILYLICWSYIVLLVFVVLRYTGVFLAFSYLAF